MYRSLTLLVIVLATFISCDCAAFIIKCRTRAGLKTQMIADNTNLNLNFNLSSLCRYFSVDSLKLYSIADFT